MKIAVTSTGDSLEDQVAFRMGRNAFYLIVDPDSMDAEPIENPDKTNNVEASALCAELMRDRGVRVVMTGHCGPEAHKIFGNAGISVLPGLTGTVDEVVRDFRQSPGYRELLEEPPAVVERVGGKRNRKSVSYEEYLQLKAEMVVMQRKLLDLQRRVMSLEG